MSHERPIEVINRYLDDAIAAEKSCEAQLRGLLREDDHSDAQQLFEDHAQETRIQCERLTCRLEALKGRPSMMKSFLTRLFVFGPNSLPLELVQREDEVTVQNLVVAFAVENAEIAMYEALSTAAATAGDKETEELARSIQDQEREMAGRLWGMLPRAARIGFLKVTSGETQTV